MAEIHCDDNHMIDGKLSIGFWGFWLNGDGGRSLQRTHTGIHSSRHSVIFSNKWDGIKNRDKKFTSIVLK